MNSRIRSAGADHGIENRLVIWAFTCEPTPSRNRPPEYNCKSLATKAIDIGLRANVTAIAVPS